VFELLEEYPGMVLKLMSHTDSRGSEKANQELSEKRAISCVEYLVNEKGVDPSRLIPVGKGENSPRTVYKVGDDYLAKPPKDGTEYEPILLTEQYLNQYQRSNKIMFEKLHQYNRRTEAEVVRMDWTADEKKEEGEGDKENE
jgi:outer membrane protein OmpA-like peptidoglycan-associated protein